MLMVGRSEVPRDREHEHLERAMSYTASTERYLEAEVMSRPKEWLVPLMYEHLLKHLRRATIQIETRDIEGKATSLEKAQSIVLELAGSLDHEKGGEIAQRLSALYAYFAGELITIGRTLDTAHLNRLIDMIADLHDGWVQAATQVAPRGRSTPSMLSLGA
jgi:flagellar secretion chaperone FliS